MNIHKLSVSARIIAGLLCIFVIVLWILTCTTELPSPTAAQDDNEEDIVNGYWGVAPLDSTKQYITCEENPILWVWSGIDVRTTGFDYDTAEFNYGIAYHPDSVIIIKHVFTDTTIIWGAR